MKMYYCTRKSVFRHVPCIHGLCRKIGYRKLTAGEMIAAVKPRDRNV